MSTTLYVGNLAWTVTGDSLESHFTAAGYSVVTAEVAGEATGRSKGYGIVELSTGE
jgi:RNA recognition motif-containing protein